VADPCPRCKRVGAGCYVGFSEVECTREAFDPSAQDTVCVAQLKVGDRLVGWSITAITLVMETYEVVAVIAPRVLLRDSSGGIWQFDDNSLRIYRVTRAPEPPAQP